MLRLLFIIALVLIIQVRDVALASDLQTPASPSVTVPFDGSNNLIVINATVNDQGPYRFMIDTGSSEHVISREVANALGLNTTGAARVDVGREGLTDAELTNIDKLKIGDLILRSQRFFIAALPKSYPFQGILGAELFKQFVVTIDFAHSFITLAAQDKSVNQVSGGAHVSLKLRGVIPRVHAKVDGFSGWFKIDTGYNGSLALFAEFVAAHKSLSKTKSPQVYEPGGQTIAGPVANTRIVQIKLFAIETVGSSSAREVVQRDMAAALFTEKGGSNSAYAGAIGTLVLQRYRVTFNYRERIVILETIPGR
jgi:predicted aspartyl protease